MAFVFGKARKTSSLEHRSMSPGPGEYLPIEKQQDEGFAPFNSSTFKTSTFDIVPSNTGPGCYDPKCPRQQLQQNKQHRMTSSFCSKVQRFKTQQAYKPHPKSQKMMRVSLAEQSEPRKYTSQHHKTSKKEVYSEAIQRKRQKMSALQSQNKRRKTDSIGASREFVRILLSNPNNTEMMHSVFIEKSINKKEKGPGSYDIESSKQICNKRSGNVVDWSKNTGNRFKQRKDRNPGPGAYQVDNALRKSQSCMSSSFAYQGLRSHMDELIYKTKMPFKVKVIEEKGLKDRYPGPGYYNPRRVSSKSFHYGQDCFGSSQYQNDECEPIYQAPGPGYYVYKQKGEDLKQELKKTREKIFRKTKLKIEKSPNLCEQNREEVRNQCLMEIERTANKFYSLKQRCSSKVGNFPHALRFDEKDGGGSPGPGQYSIPPRQQDYNAVHHGFNSTSQDRCSFVRSAENMSFYDLSRNDIGKVATRIKKNIQNLRQIDIQKAPFNSKEQRFKAAHACEQRVPQKVDHQMVTWNTQANEYKQARFQMMKSVMEEQVQPSAAFKSSTKRAWVIPSHYQGPGNYCQASSLQKKSFNQDYNYKAPMKIRSTYRTRSSMV